MALADSRKILDLRGKDLYEMKALSLEREWQFYFNAFLSAHEMENQQVAHYEDLPNSWTGGMWNGELMPPHGYATYYLKILVDAKYQDLSLKVLPLGTAYKLIINDQVINEVGKVGNTADTTEPFYKGAVCSIPAHNGEINIIFHVANFNYRKGGLWQIPVFGPTSEVYNLKQKNVRLEFFLFGSILFMGLYHLGLYAFKYRRTVNLIFPAICFSTVLRSSVVGELTLVDMFLALPWGLTVRIEFITFYLILISTAVFIRALFRHLFPLWLLKTVIYVGALASLFTIVVPVTYSSYLVNYMQIFTLMTGVGTFYYLLKGVYAGETEAIIFTTGLTIVVIAMMNDFAYFNNWVSTGSYFALGLFLFFFSHTMIMARRFSFTFTQVKEMTGRLQRSNLELEQKVQQRTHELTTKNHELERLNKENNDLISVVVHDLKAPFRRIKALTSLFKVSGDMNSKQQDVLSFMERANDQGITSIKDLMLLYNDKELELKYENIELRTLVDNLVVGYKQIAAEKNIRLNVNDIDSDLSIESDRVIISRIIDNLLSNAIKFSPFDRLVTIDCLAAGESVVIAVQDQGPGIPEEERHLLFRKFQKLSATTGSESSTGLGLSIVDQLVKQLKGTIEVESEVGKGSTFRVILPLVPQP